MSEIVRFDLLKINKDSQRLCQCRGPHFEVDSVNRMVECTLCGAYVDPFFVFEIFMEQFDDYISEINRLHGMYLHEVEAYKEMANKVLRHRFKIKAFKELEEDYFRNLLPVCPVCNEHFDPADIKRATNRGIVENKKVEKNKEE